MTRRRLFGWLITVLAVGLFSVTGVRAQNLPDAPPAVKSPGRAFATSLLLPGLGHRYVQDGHWRGWATVFAGTDVALWVSLFHAGWRHDQLVRSYETLAATRAGADIAGKNRAFFLNVATYRSSDAYLDAQLRNRAWDRLDYVSDPSFQWAWQSEADFLGYRGVRDDAETYRRRRSLVIASLVANRLIAGVLAVVAANKRNGSGAADTMSIHVQPGPAGARAPMVHLGLRF